VGKGDEVDEAVADFSMADTDQSEKITPHSPAGFAAGK